MHLGCRLHASGVCPVPCAHPLAKHNKNQSFGCSYPNVGFQWLENGCTQGSFLKWMHARVFWNTDVRNHKGHFDGCTQRTFWQRIRARYGPNPGCAQPISRMRATLLTWWSRYIQRTWHFLYQFKKVLENRSSRFETKISLISFSRGSETLKHLAGPRPKRIQFNDGCIVLLLAVV